MAAAANPAGAKSLSCLGLAIDAPGRGDGSLDGRDASAADRRPDAANTRNGFSPAAAVSNDEYLADPMCRVWSDPRLRLFRTW